MKMKTLKSNSSYERGETKIMVIAILMGLAILYSAGTFIAGWMHDEMLDRSEKSEDWLRHQGPRPKQKFDTERPIRGQTITY